VRKSSSCSSSIERVGERIGRGIRPLETTQIAWIYECLTRVREEPHKLHGSMKLQQESVGLCAGKDRLSISYNEMSICSPVSYYAP